MSVISKQYLKKMKLLAYSMRSEIVVEWIETLKEMKPETQEDEKFFSFLNMNIEIIKRRRVEYKS